MTGKKFSELEGGWLSKSYGFSLKRAVICAIPAAVLEFVVIH